MQERSNNNPSSKKEFNNAQNNIKKQQVDKRREMVTNQMAQNLENERASPSSQNNLTPPGGAMPTQAYQQASNKREARIRYIRERMNESQERLRKGFDQSK